MAVFHSELRLATYNCKGWDNGIPITSNLLRSHDICLIQEHRLFDDHLNLLIQIFFQLVLVVWTLQSCFRVALLGVVRSSSESLQLAQLPIYTMLSTISKRFCAIRLSDQSGCILLIICVYLPTDYGTSSSHDDFLFVLGELEGFINSESFDSLLISMLILTIWV